MIVTVVVAAAGGAIALQEATTPFANQLDNDGRNGRLVALLGLQVLLLVLFDERPKGPVALVRVGGPAAARQDVVGSEFGNVLYRHRHHRGHIIRRWRYHGPRRLLLMVVVGSGSSSRMMVLLVVVVGVDWTWWGWGDELAGVRVTIIVVVVQHRRRRMLLVRKSRHSGVTANASAAAAFKHLQLLRAAFHQVKRWPLLLRLRLCFCCIRVSAVVVVARESLLI